MSARIRPLIAALSSALLTVTLIGQQPASAARPAWTPPKPHYERGYGAMFSQHIGQADEGCDFDFLLSGAATPEPEIH